MYRLSVTVQVATDGDPVQVAPDVFVQLQQAIVKYNEGELSESQCASHDASSDSGRWRHY